MVCGVAVVERSRSIPCVEGVSSDALLPCGARQRVVLYMSLPMALVTPCDWSSWVDHKHSEGRECHSDLLVLCGVCQPERMSDACS